MTDEEFNEFDSAIRMTGFFATNNDLLKTNAKALSTNAALIANISVLETTGAKRISAAGLRKDGTLDKLVTKDSLNILVRKIAETGKTIKKEEPDFDNKFKVPGGNLSGQQLLDIGNAFISDLTPVTATKFSNYGMSQTLSADLTAEINNFEAARAQQNTGKGSGIAATAQTKAAIADLKKNRRPLKTIVKNLLETNGDAGLIAEWKSACKVEKPKSTPPTPATPPDS